MGHNPTYCVDGHEFPDEDSPWMGDGQYPPFMIFCPDAQNYLPEKYETREAAQEVTDRLNKAFIAPCSYEGCPHPAAWLCPQIAHDRNCNWIWLPVCDVDRHSWWDGGDYVEEDCPVPTLPLIDVRKST